MTLPLSSDVDQNGKGIAYMIAGVAGLSMMDAVVKWLAGDYSVWQITFFRHIFGMIPVIFLIIWDGGIGALKTRRIFTHICRTALAFTGGFCIFASLAYLPLADVYAIFFTAPLLMTAIAIPMLGERVGWRRWSAIGVGFIGILVMLNSKGLDSGAFLDTGIVFALIGTICYAIAMVWLRRMVRTETNAAIGFYGTVFAVVMSIGAIPFVWITPSLFDLFLFFSAGILGGSGSVMLLLAFRNAEASIVAPFEYTAMVWAVVLGYAIWQELPDGWVLSGCALVIMSGLYIIHREAGVKQPARVMPASGGPDR